MRVYLVIVALILSGCKTIIPTYTTEQINSGLLAKLITEKKSFFDSGLSYYIHEVYSLDGEPIRKPGLNGRTGTNELYLPAGKYRIILLCTVGYGSAEPEMIVELEEGKLYLAECEEVGKAENIFGMKTISVMGARLKEIQSETDL